MMMIPEYNSHKTLTVKFNPIAEKPEDAKFFLEITGSKVYQVTDTTSHKTDVLTLYADDHLKDRLEDLIDEWWERRNGRT